MEPGIYTDIEENTYHAINAIGSSTIKRFHYRPSSILEPMEVSEDMNLGSAQDCYSLMGPEYFHKKFVVAPEFGDMRKTDNKVAMAEWELAVTGKVILPATVTPKKIPTMKAIKDVDNFLFNLHPCTKELLRTGQQQVSVFWQDEVTGLLCKGRFDHAPDRTTKTLIDLKKCGQIGKFRNQIRSLRYDLQAGHYTVGANANGYEVDAFGFIAFNFGNPPQAKVIWITGEALSEARDISKQTVSLIQECRQAGKYPDYEIPLNTTRIVDLRPGDFVDEISERRYGWW